MKKIYSLLLLSLICSLSFAQSSIWTGPNGMTGNLGTYSLGDKISSSAWNYNYYVGTSAQVNNIRVGLTFDGTIWDYYGPSSYGAWTPSSNYAVSQDISAYQFKQTGTCYVVGQALDNSSKWSMGGNDTWNNSDVFNGGNSASFTVTVLDNPTPVSATISGTTATLNWNRDSKPHDVLIVRYLKDTSPTAPINGTAYSVNGALGSGTVVYLGSGTSTTNTVASNTDYDYYFYSENFSYYSSGVKITAIGTGLYYRSVTSGNWNTTTTWEQSPNNSAWSPAIAIPSSTALSVTIVSGHTVSVDAAISTPASANFIVDGTLKITSTNASVSTAPTYSVNSTLQYDLGSGVTRSVGSEWAENAQSDAGYPYNVTVTSGTVNIDGLDTKTEHLYAQGDLTISSGATLYCDMLDESTLGWSQKGLNIAGDITNAGTIELSSDCHQALSCDNFTNTGQTILSALSNGGDLYITGDYYNNGASASAVNFNGRALVMTGSKNQIVGGTAPGIYEIDYFIVAKPAGTLVTLQHDLLADGEGNGQSGGGAVTVNGATLDISGRTVQIARNIAGYYSTITTDASGTIRTDASTELYVLGDETTQNTGVLSFDQSTPGVTNVIGVLELDRSNSQAKLKVDNNFIVDKFLRIKQGLLESSADIQLASTAVGTLSSTNTTSALTAKNLVFCKTAAESAEFYKNARALTLTSGVRTKVTFDQTDKWHFISFPYAVSSVKKSDGTTAASLDTDYNLGQYNAAKRAINISGWETSTDNPMVAGKGYIINKAATLEDLYFDGNISGSDEMFNSATSVTLTYTPATPITLVCNAGWNFISHPMSASASPTLATGEFAYNYDPTQDTYKLWYYSYNAGYTYGTSVLIPFTAFFVKTPDASNVTMTISDYANPQGVMRKAPMQTLSDEVIIPINLNVNNVHYETLVRVLSDATTGQDEMYDAPYNTPMTATTPRLYTLIDGVQYALNSVPEGSTIPVGLRIPTSGTYDFTWVSPEGELKATLTDLLTGTVTDMTANTSYEFTTATTGDINNRFVINVLQKVPTQVDVTNNGNFTISTTQNKISVQGLIVPSRATLFDMSGKLLQTRSVNAEFTDFENLKQGIYLLQILDNVGNHTMKVVVH